MNPKFAEALRLHMQEKMTYAQIAVKMGCAVGTVRSRINRARYHFGCVALEMVLQERLRQKTVEGYSIEHDDKHKTGDLLLAARLYWHNAVGIPGLEFSATGAPVNWPFEPERWKPKDCARDLVRAAAMCLAEYDRVVRCGESEGPARHLYSNILRALNQWLIMQSWEVGCAASK